MVKKKTKKTAPRATAKSKPKAKSRKTSGLMQQSYSLSPELQEIVGAKKLSRPEVVKKLWVYIKARKCQDTKNRRMIVPDAKLAEVIGKKPVDMLKLAGCLSKHLKKD